LQGDLGLAYGQRLVGCIDHHDEEDIVPQECGEEPRIVQKSGSCSSLVVEYCRDAWNTLSRRPESKDSASWDADLARLALAPILIDTTNLTNDYKVTPVDVKAAKYLESFIQADPTRKFDREDYFQRITAAKNDIGGLSLSNILRKDYKQWTVAGTTNLGISSVVKDIQFLIDKAGGKAKFFAAMKDFARERNLSMYSIMTASQKDGTFGRELLIWALDERGVYTAERFEADSKEKLGLQQWGDGTLDLRDDAQWRRCWQQHKVENSRKQIAPMLKTYMQKI
jgi:exopolyphosphatase